LKNKNEKLFKNVVIYNVVKEKLDPSMATLIGLKVAYDNERMTLYCPAVRLSRYTLGLGW